MSNGPEAPEAPRGALVRWASLAALVVIVALGVVAFAQARDDTAEPTGQAFVPANLSDPADLVGAWWPQGRASLEGWLVTISPTSEFAVFSDSCAVDGMWRGSTSGLVTFYPYAAGGECDGVLNASNEWFAGVSWLTVYDDRLELLDTTGEVLLTLTAAPDRSTWPESTHESSYLLRALDDPYPYPDPVTELPSGVEVPVVPELVDIRWKPLDMPATQPDRIVDESADKAFVQFATEGYWEGSDGCNGQWGTWALHPDTGEWLATSGVSTLMGCSNVSVAELVTGSRAVGLDGDELVFYATDGTEVGRFVGDND